VQLFLNGTADFLNRLISLHKKSCLLQVLLCVLLMQSCAQDFTVTGQVPGRVLSINSLGLRETSNDIGLKEIDPYTVRVTRNICKTEVLSIKYQALTETKYGTQYFDCRDAYATYIAHNITALGVPFLYDSVTGFNLLKKRCTEKPPVYRVVTTESNDIINEEATDSNTTACKELPVADVLLTAKINDAVVYMATEADGIASLPPEKIAQLESAAINTSITFRYEETQLVTRHLRKEPKKPPQFGIFAMNSPTGENVTTQENESAVTENSVPEIAVKKGFVAALTPPATDPLSPPDIVQSGVKSGPAAIRPVNGEKKKAATGNEAVVELSTPAGTAPEATVPEPVGEMAVGAIKSAPASGKTASDEKPVMAKIARESGAVKSSPAPPGTDAGGTEAVGKMAVGATKAAPAPEKIAAAATPSMAQRDQESIRKNSSPKIVSEGESSSDAGRQGRVEIKSAAPAPVPRKTLSQLMVGPKAVPEPTANEIFFRQILIMSPELYRLCCPLTDKLFWNSGN